MSVWLGELNMSNFELLKVEVNENNEQVINGRNLHEFLEINTPYVKWFNRMKEYGFEENVDYLTVDKNVLRADGTKMPQKQFDHILTLDMAKELCMIQRTPLGRQARQYFIQVEKEYKKLSKGLTKDFIERQISIRLRKDMTDAIKEVIPETTHKKFAYSNYTNLVYKIIFGKSAKEIKLEKGLSKNDNIRDYLPKEELMKVEMIENLVKTYLYAGLEYEQIKNVLRATFTNGVQLVCHVENKKLIA